MTTNHRTAPASGRRRVSIEVQRVYYFGAHEGIEALEPGETEGPDGEASWFAVYFREKVGTHTEAAHFVDFDPSDAESDVRMLAEALSKHLGIPAHYAYEVSK